MPNRLAQEKSPYLLQHAHNPVDWYPWGEAAFAKAGKWLPFFGIMLCSEPPVYPWLPGAPH